MFNNVNLLDYSENRASAKPDVNSTARMLAYKLFSHKELKKRQLYQLNCKPGLKRRKGDRKPFEENDPRPELLKKVLKHIFINLRVEDWRGAVDSINSIGRELKEAERKRIEQRLYSHYMKHKNSDGTISYKNFDPINSVVSESS